jgi:hypothetical protein
MDISECLDSFQYCVLQVWDGISVRKPYYSLHAGKNVLRTMLGLASEEDDMLLLTFSLADVANDLRRSDDLAQPDS